MILIEQIAPPDIDRAWPHVSQHLSRAVKRMKGALTLDDIQARTLRGEYGLWAIYESEHPLPFLASAVTFITGDLITIAFLGGFHMKRWMKPALEQFEAMAKQHGMTAIEIEGRFGWQRALPDFTPERISIRKAL